MPRRLSVWLGAIGLLAAGPLVSTLLSGRTGAVPSLRWLGLSLAGWVTVGALAWGAARGRPTRAATTLAPLSPLSLFLPWAYLDDQAFHALTGGRSLVLVCLG